MGKRKSYRARDWTMGSDFIPTPRFLEFLYMGIDGERELLFGLSILNIFENSIACYQNDYILLLNKCLFILKMI